MEINTPINPEAEAQLAAERNNAKNQVHVWEIPQSEMERFGIGILPPAPKLELWDPLSGFEQGPIGPLDEFFAILSKFTKINFEFGDDGRCYARFIGPRTGDLKNFEKLAEALYKFYGYSEPFVAYGNVDDPTILMIEMLVPKEYCNQKPPGAPERNDDR